MVKVYDMVTYGLCDPEQDVPSLDFGSPSAERMADLALGLQQIESASTPRRETMHPALQCMDVDSFLAEFGD